MDSRELDDQEKAIQDLDFHLQMLWKMCPFDFEASVQFMEMALKFECTETAYKIREHLRSSHPFSWSAYKKSCESDNSSADGSDNR